MGSIDDRVKVEVFKDAVFVALRDGEAGPPRVHDDGDMVITILHGAMNREAVGYIAFSEILPIPDDELNAAAINWATVIRYALTEDPTRDGELGH